MGSLLVDVLLKTISPAVGGNLKEHAPLTVVGLKTGPPDVP